MPRKECKHFSMAKCPLRPQPLLPSCPLSPAAPPSTMISQPELQTTKHTCPQEAMTFILPILAHTVPSAQTAPPSSLPGGCSHPSKTQSEYHLSQASLTVLGEGFALSSGPTALSASLNAPNR